MPSFSPRIVLPFCVLAGLLSGCASGRSNTGESENPATGTTVTSDDIERNPGQPIEQILQAKVPGVWITRTADGGIAIQLRGSSSVYGNNAPLYIVDGMAIHPGPNGSLVGVNPYDIESIRVLKDPADIAMYGVRGANGVILIRTKRSS